MKNKKNKKGLDLYKWGMKQLKRLLKKDDLMVLSHHDEAFSLPGFLSPEVAEGSIAKEVRSVNIQTQSFQCGWDEVAKDTTYRLEMSGMVGKGKVNGKNVTVRKCGGCHRLIWYYD